MSFSFLKGIARNLRFAIDRFRARSTYQMLADGNIENYSYTVRIPLKPHVLFITSNGAGMGHITRCLAIATAGARLFNSSFLTMSSSASVVGMQGFEYLYFQSAASTGQSARIWNNNLYHLLKVVLKRNTIDAIVFDGTWIYQGLRDALNNYPHIDLIWLRRGLWKKGSKTDQLPVMESVCSRIISPWDIGKAFDSGTLVSTTTSRCVKGIVFTPRASLNRVQAIEELRLNATKQYALIQLGAGAINNIDEIRDFVIEEIRRISNNTLVPIVAVSPLSKQEVVIDTEQTIKRYPIAPYLSAFDLVVSAAGYNSVHEIIRENVCALVIANKEASTDDQEARARGAAVTARCIAASSKVEVRHGLEVLIRGISQSAEPLSTSLKNELDNGLDAARAIFETLHLNSTVSGRRRCEENLECESN